MYNWSHIFNNFIVKVINQLLEIKYIENSYLCDINNKDNLLNN